MHLAWCTCGLFLSICMVGQSQGWYRWPWCSLWLPHSVCSPVHNNYKENKHNTLNFKRKSAKCLPSGDDWIKSCWNSTTAPFCFGTDHCQITYINNANGEMSWRWCLNDHFILLVCRVSGWDLTACNIHSTWHAWRKVEQNWGSFQWLQWTPWWLHQDSLWLKESYVV